MHKNKITLKDIAEKADVSIATVSRALRNDTGVAEATRRSIREVAQEMGFPVLSFDKGSQLGPVIVLVLDSGWGSFFNETLRELARRGEERNYDVIIHRTPRYDTIRHGLTKVVGMTEGVVVLGTWDTLTDADAEIIAGLSVPVVLINRYIGGCTSAVTLDDFGTGLTAARYLANLGHKRIAYLPGVQSSTAMKNRLRGFRTGLEQRGLFDPELCTEPLHGNTLEWACRCVKTLLELPQPPTAIWTCNDIAASAVIVSLETQGIDVPKQISVMGHDHLLQTHDLELTTFDYRLTELGYHVAYVVEGFLREELRGAVHISLMPELIEGGTTGPPPTIGE